MTIVRSIIERAGEPCIFSEEDVDLPESPAMRKAYYTRRMHAWMASVPNWTSIEVGPAEEDSCSLESIVESSDCLDSVSS